MKIYILYELKNTPSGGGNQFLNAVKHYFVNKGVYTELINDADIVLFNSHQHIVELLKYKLKYPNKLFIHRIDGPMRLYNNMDDKRDLIVNIVNKYIADGTIFQSDWSKNENLKMGIERNKNEVTILNAPNLNIFNKDGKKKFDKNLKIKLIFTSWSTNMKKGFEIYRWLDSNLDFSKYMMTFVGNSPVEFKNIIYKNPMNSQNLAKELKKHDIFITASQKDPCSNSLIEALHCGLPAIGLNDGGHNEIIGKGGEVFDDKEDILNILEKIIYNYESYQNNIFLPTIDEVGEKYYKFLKDIYSKQQNQNYEPKKFGILDYLNIKKTLLSWELGEKISGIKEKICV